MTTGVRTLIRVPAFIAATVALAVTLLGRVASGSWPFGLVTNFPVQLALASALLTVIALVVRARITLVVAIAGLVLNGLILAPELTGDRRTARVRTAALTVGHLNAQTRPIDVAALSRHLAAIRPDVFVVLDPDQSDARLLNRATPGYTVYRTGARVTTDPDFVRTVVLSRAPIDHVRRPANPDFGASAVEVVVSAGAPISIVVFGTDSPTTSGRAQNRDRALRAAARWSRSRPPRRIVMGDFNATPWSSPFRELIHDGRLFDTLNGFGLQVSWPESNFVLRIPIDHALLGPGLAATERGTGPSFGSQHRSLLVTVTARSEQ